MRSCLVNGRSKTNAQWLPSRDAWLAGDRDRGLHPAKVMAGDVAPGEGLPGLRECVRQLVRLPRLDPDPLRLVVAHSAHRLHLLLVRCLGVLVAEIELVIEDP